MTAWVVWALYFTVLDGFLTYANITALRATEANPLLSKLIAQYGLLDAMAIRVVVGIWLVALLCLFLQYRIAQIGLKAATVAVGGAAGANLLGVLL